MTECPPPAPQSGDRRDHGQQVREAMERWARWREGARHRGPDGISPVGKFMSGRGSATCPTCRGAKRMPGHLVGSSFEFLNVPCPHCAGTGKVDGDLDMQKHTREIDCVFCADPVTGTANGETATGGTCHKCHGGKRLIISLKVHPATIAGTRRYGGDHESDPLSARIEEAVESWLQRNITYWLARVVVEEYCRNGTQEMKATRLRVSRPWYCRNLSEAHLRVRGLMRHG